jgi:hypothetical protein
MNMTHVCVQFGTHCASISVDHKGRILVFKHTDASCDFDLFEDSDTWAASDYVLSPPSALHWYVTIPGETPPHLVP